MNCAYLSFPISSKAPWLSNRATKLDTELPQNPILEPELLSRRLWICAHFEGWKETTILPYLKTKAGCMAKFPLPWKQIQVEITNETVWSHVFHTELKCCFYKNNKDKILIQYDKSLLGKMMCYSMDQVWPTRGESALKNILWYTEWYHSADDDCSQIHLWAANTSKNGKIQYYSGRNLGWKLETMGAPCIDKLQRLQ